jgi:hypothetical protein
MNSSSSVSVTLRVLLAALVLALAGCANGDIDDPDASNAILTITKIEPSLVEVSPASPPADFLVAVTVDSTIRTPGASYTDVILNKVTLLYDPPLASGVASTSTTVTLTVPSGGTLTITNVPVVEVGDVGAGDLNTERVVTVFVEGEDLLGKPASATGTMTLRIVP